MMYALGIDGGSVRQFVTAADEAAALAHAQPGEVAVAFSGAFATGGLIQNGAVVFPDPTAEAITEKQWQAVRNKRDALTNYWAWTYRVDSPLSPECQARWVQWAKKLNRITVDYDDPAAVVWPDQPAMFYA